ncbi:MAG: hypothetical protein M1830_005785 [Pleopsidium flavum]|nr:MAG: hypothetical protein M1830_005785 [Pleopsidium flavum]
MADRSDAFESHRSDRSRAFQDFDYTATTEASSSDGSDDNELNRPEGGTGGHRSGVRTGLNGHQDFAMSREEYDFEDEEQDQHAPIVDDDPSTPLSYRADEGIDDDHFTLHPDLANDADYYSILALPRSPAPTSARIRAAFHSLSLRFHPDKQPPHRRAMAEQQYARIQQAYETLNNPQKRVVYDLLGEEGVRVEWGVGGSMGRSGEAQHMQIGVKAMTEEDFRQWFLAVMKKRERDVLEELVRSGGQITLRLNAVPLFHSYLFHPNHSGGGMSRLFPQFSNETDPPKSLESYPPLVQATNLNIKHNFKVPLPWLARFFDAGLPQWPGMRGHSADNRTVSSRRHWSDAAKDDVPGLTIATGMGGKLVQLTPQASPDTQDVDESEVKAAVPSIPAILARTFSLGGSLQHTFPEKPDKSSTNRSISSLLQGSMLGIHTLILPQRIVQTSITRAVNFADGTRPLICRLQTTFHDLPKRVPPVIDVHISRQLGNRHIVFCSWSSGGLLWPNVVARIMNPLITFGVDPKVAYALGGGINNMCIGLKAFPPTPASHSADSNTEGDKFTAESKDTDTAIPVPAPKPDSQESWEFQVDASPYGSSFSVQYGRNVFATGVEPPLQSDLTNAGDKVNPSWSATTVEGARGVRLEIQSTIGLDLSLGWTIKGTRPVGDFTRVGVGVGVQGNRGLVVLISWSRLGHAINLPIAVCPAEILSKNAAMWALAVPWGTYLAVDFGIVRPRARRKRKEDIANRRKELRRLLEKRKSEAGQAITLLRDQVERRQFRERERGGLVILKADYGVKESRRMRPLATQSGDIWHRNQVTDVTIAVAALVDSGQLVIPRRMMKSQIIGFYDPAPLCPKVLRDPPKEKKKEEEKKEWVFVPEGAEFYPIGGYSQQPQPYYYTPSPAPAQASASASAQQYTHHHWYGSSKAEVDAENMAIAQTTGATKPTHLIPYKPSPSQQWWCRELDGSYTLRTTNDIMDNLQPGFWQYAQPGGYPYFIRQEK